MQKRNLVAVGIFVAFYVCFGIYLTLNQEQIVYQPSAQDFDACEDFRTAEKVNYQDTRMYVADLTKPVIIFYHGNAGSTCDRSFYSDFFSDMGYGYIMVEYAGYSNDARQPSHELIKQDVRNVIAYVEEKRLTNMSLIGESIGTGAASYHTELAPPEKLLLISPFTDLTAVARTRFWFYPTSLLVDNAFDTVHNLQDYARPVTIIHGTNDSIIPYDLGRQLFHSLKTDKTLVAIPEAGHNDLFYYPETTKALRTFLNKN